ncbi:citrate lyase holo-[acyl-carrier protein] synthase [Erwiniaceae bacterium BAC15a-03b]|uniref:Apo-citrate lyase phosphoribosyl-dephospho-CoA transferase n=1 Tax=Winslowiella arboricola TaxID=2978220 RepID=A0A9J6PQ73_9GAMM|nr:citrate lyase holo-[acyl-carrier protein] synthase [Winslowiella arboricola]MCU5774331.1 citrate lyase holo-[acyl-carrier protein] synthase [Winslowiella arboricola]MCU5778878.1 citrate lyase holo-[acyl-carrier protein] synthase [Winslowiella arboricola]
MSTLTPATAGVTLSELLDAREARAQRQSDWLTRYARPLVSLTLVTPGAVKDNSRYHRTMGIALQACDQLFWQHHWPVVARQVLWLPTGAEALWCIDHGAPEIKAATVALEAEHPLGRLWDIDVICPQQGLIGRRSLDEASRRCLICDGPAHACARARQHPLEQVVKKVEGIIDAWFTRD